MATITEYLRYFPQPLLDDIVAGQWLPVIGAGMSLNAKLRPNARMPLWPDLGDALSKDLPDYNAAGTLDAISAYQHEYGRVKLIEKLSELLHIRNSAPGDVHKEFCSIPCDIVCTTNFDFLLERQYDATPHYVHTIVDEEQLSVNTPKPGTMLLKLHGDLRHPSRLVVTEEDYDNFLNSYPLIATFLANQLITKTAVFIGYSLDDPDFRQVWAVVAKRLGRSRRLAYTVMVDAKQSEIARFERRGVKVISLPGSRDKYGEILATAFRELREYVLDHAIDETKVTEPGPLAELQIPRGYETRLCFFSLPIEMVSAYKRVIFPLVEQIGLVPVTASDVVSVGDNVTAKIEALIDRSAVVVVDYSTQWTRAEYEIALAKTRTGRGSNSPRRPLRLVVVTGRDDAPPASMEEFLHIQRPSSITANGDAFAAQLLKVLTDVVEKIGPAIDDEATRLFEAKEYRAALIAAMTHLESWLRRKASTEQWPDLRPFAPSFALIEAARKQEVFSHMPAIHEKLRGWARLRNEAVHDARPVSRAAAKEAIEGISKLMLAKK